MGGWEEGGLNEVLYVWVWWVGHTEEGGLGGWVGGLLTPSMRWVIEGSHTEVGGWWAAEAAAPAQVTEQRRSMWLKKGERRGGRWVGKSGRGQWMM